MNKAIAVGCLMLIVGNVGVATAQDSKFAAKLMESALQHVNKRLTFAFGSDRCELRLSITRWMVSAAG